jgi:hypothetical protein
MVAKQPGVRKTKKAGSAAVVKRWVLRGTIAAAIGLSIGGAGGVMTVRTLEPGRAHAIDSVQAVLDSIARGTIPEPTAAEQAAESQRQSDSVASAKAAQDSADAADADALLTVPDIVGLQEGPARDLLLEAGLLAGEVEFRASTSPAGTVLATTPPAGSRVVASSAVALVISDGRNPADSLSTLPHHPAP